MKMHMLWILLLSISLGSLVFSLFDSFDLTTFNFVYIPFANDIIHSCLV